MNAPWRVTPERFEELVEDYLKFSCYHTGSEIVDGQQHQTYACKGCYSEILWHRSYLSVHDSRFDHCVGTGTVLNPTIPYCPTCESNPMIFGCVHVGVEEPAPPIQTFWKKIAGRFLAR